MLRNHCWAYLYPFKVFVHLIWQDPMLELINTKSKQWILSLTVGRKFSKIFNDKLKPCE